MKKAKTESERKCAGCGQKDAPEHLERFVLIEEYGLIHDMRKKAQGRGAHVHPTQACLDSAVRGGFARSFKQAVPTRQLDVVIEEVSTAVRKRLDESLRVAKRAGEVAFGGTNLEVAMRENRVDVICIASDAGAATDKKFRTNADRKGTTILDGLSAKELAVPMGKNEVSVIGIQGSSARRVTRDWVALSKLGFFDSGVEQPPEHG